MLELLTDPHAWVALFTLAALEIILGIDNIVFIAVLTERLNERQARRARAIGLSLAFVFRVALLASLTWIMGLTTAIFSVFEIGFSWRDIILIAGGLFLLAKATHEIHNEVETEDQTGPAIRRKTSIWPVIGQLAVIDMVFSIDSIVTAVGLANDLEVMIAAVVIALLVMYFAAGPVGAFIAKHPTTKMLALSFLLLIGLALVADGLHFHIPRGYIYFAMAFAGAVETFNVIARRNRARKRKSPRG